MLNDENVDLFDIRRLALLVEVVEQGSITAAAEIMMYSPSAVSQQLRKLEQEVGQPLLNRRSRGVVPTEAGQVLAGHARKIVGQMRAARSDLGQIAGLNRGSLTVGTFPTLAGSFLPLVIRSFKKRYPAIGLSVRSARFDELVADLESGVTGLCLLWDYPWSRFNDEAIRITEVFQESTVILVARGHPLAERDEVTVKELRKESWIVRAEAHPVVEVLQRSAHDAGFEPNIGFLANDYQEAQAMVSVGMGVAMVPKTAVALQHPDVRVLSLGTDAPLRRVLLAQRQDKVYAPAEVAFHSTLLEIARERGSDYL
ncbi:LysR family transcriptional regulator [Paenarthrobacter aurescens]|uniref:LysR family transcriptional regulator n=1 Tax=Paenarthrobacter aurescens TaxID=43663 RepID=A0A4Y3NGH8_PAEAU|nr:LysR family transcriptional regulator [Paenarthrobacter aurescens]MDO6143427.1 LysR family transcriptional regulator [Paenarthrobacter aurescens]MDO6147275.1 LysR family transcriptional regulator [Paenarthrobacter aurescens]MDO6158519.1 LysR family transcriptional regulator [Paenarthrobacter aurescens]MDO6162502.1 LysR family transcriptional regulator [Paenarthrobacter aurescens]GEB18246.1 LysR family transcriptional regulator [Paenarthrobacter aurescens]